MKLLTIISLSLTAAIALLWWTLWLSERMAAATLPRTEIATNTMNSHDIKRLRVRTEIIKRYYVTDKDDSHCIYGGPFDTKEEAKQCLEQAKAIDAESIPLKALPHNLNT